MNSALPGRRTFNRAIAGCVLAGCPALAAHAGQPVRLDPITVSAPRVETPLSRVPGAVSIVDTEEIERAGQGLAIDKPLLRVPGVFTQNRYNFAQDVRVSIRGFGARTPFGIRGVRILVDGIPATLPDGQSSLDALDVDSLSRIEVLRGAASSLYGNASGGVIDATTNDIPDDPFARAESSVGADDFTRHVFRAGGRSGDLGFAATATRLDYDGFRDFSETESTHFSSKFEYRVDENTDVTFVARAVDAPLARDPGGLTAAEAAADRRQASTGNRRFDAGESLDEQQFGVLYRRSLDERRELRLRGYTVGREFSNKLPFTDGGQVAFDRRFSGIGILYTDESPWHKRSNRLLLGVDIDRQRDDRQRYDNRLGRRGRLAFDQLETVTGTGVFIQNEFAMTDRLSATAGLRHDRLTFSVDDRFFADGVDDSAQDTLREWSPKIGATFSLNPETTFYANVAYSFETPTTTEFARCTGGGFVDDLEPQTALTWELGAGARMTPDIRFSTALYHTQGTDEIVARGCPGQAGRDFFVNAGRTTRNGIEIAFEAGISAHWNASLAYTYADFDFDRFATNNGTFDGNTIPGVPRHTLFGELRYRHEKGWFATLDAIYTGEFYADNANRVIEGGALVAGLQLGYERRLGNWEAGWFLGVNNVFDETYNSNVRINAFGGRHFEPSPGRNLYGGVSVRYHFSASEVSG